MKKLSFLVFFLLISIRIVLASCSSTPNLGLNDCSLGTARSVVDPAWVANFLKLDFNFHTPLARSGVDISLGTVPEAKGGTNQMTYVTGDTLHATATNTLGKLTGNISITRKFRQQHGNGSAVTSDNWDGITEPDLPSVRITALSQLDGTICAANEYLRNDSGTAWVCDLAGSLLSNILQISDSLCTAGQQLRHKLSGSGWECFTPASIIPLSVMNASTGTGTIGGAIFDWFHLQGISTVTTTEGDVSTPMPAGTFKKIGVEILTPQSTDSDGYTIGLAKVGTGITIQCTVFGTGTLSCTSTSDLAVADGDEFSWIAIGNGSYTPTIAKVWAIFSPTAP